MASEKLQRLDELTIDRGVEGERAGGGRGRLVVGGAVVGLGALFALAFVLGLGGDRAISNDAVTEPATAGSERAAPAPSKADADPAPPAETPAPAQSARTGSATRDATVLNATGYVVARRAATVSATTTGKVVEVLIEEGATVRKGEVMARLDDRIERTELALAEAQLAAAESGLQELRTALEKAQRQRERAEALGERELVSRSEIEDLRLDAEAAHARLVRGQRDVAVARRRVATQRERLADLEIRAPFAGVVVERTAQPGEMISPISAGGGFTRTGIGTVVDMAALEVEVDVNEAYIHRVAAGQRVSITLNAYPEQPYQGRVLTVIPTADRTKATIRVRIGFTKKDERVLPDMGVQVAFFDDQST